jgi:hypothetical protein
MNGKKLLEKVNIDDEDHEHYDRSLTNEAGRVLDEIRYGVELAEISDKLEKTESVAYINLRTLEKKDYCVELSTTGFRIVSYEFDTIDSKLNENSILNTIRFESYESLMNQISPLFVKKFNDLVAERLNLLE